MAQEDQTTMAETTDEYPASPTEGPTATANASLRKLLPLAWPLFTVMWLLFPIGSVVGMLRTHDFAPVGLLAFLAAMAAYAAIYLWLALRYPFRANESSRAERRARTALLAALAALALGLELVYGSGIPYQFMFVVIAAAVTLPTRRAAWTVVAIVVLASGIYALRSGWSAVASTWESAVAPFVIVGFSMILVGRLVVTVRELQEAREEIARLAVAEERLRFARDLHDLLGHSLSLITLKSTLAGRLLPVTPETEKAAREIRDVEGVAREALVEVREAVSGYRRPTLDDELAGACEMLEAAGIACRIERETGPLPGATETVLAWAVREGVTNSMRHSRAERCEIRVLRGGEEVRAEISDDGKGSTQAGEEQAAGSGLPGLAERVGACGGTLEARPLPEGGFLLRVSLPLRYAATPAARRATRLGGSAVGEWRR